MVMIHITNRGEVIDMSGVAIYVGKKGTIDIDKFTLDVEVKDVKQAYGNTLLLVVPCGTATRGEKWITAEKVKLEA
jgi:hypothetical protein